MIQLIRGFKDILPQEMVLWQKIENTAKEIFENFGYQEIRLPIMEKTELFARGVGETTDIVEKEMYSMDDGRRGSITLRPEATASAVRSYIQHKIYGQEPVQKIYTIGPMFRRERPQKGRYRQFYQIDAEVFGIKEPQIDAQMIFMLTQLFKALNVPDTMVHLNSLGCPECRPKFQQALLDLLSSAKGDLCEDCNRRIDKNPLRVLDCKVEACRNAVKDAPSILDYLCGECDDHFETVKRLITNQGISYKIDKRLVRGLDYYTRTIFEIQTTSLGAQSAVAGGGRYDGLIETLGGPSQPAIGFAIGFDRLAELLALQETPVAPGPDVFIAYLGDESRDLAYGWSCELSASGVRSEMDFSNRSLKSLMKKANKVNAKFSLILGESEIENKTAILKNMSTKEQFDIPFDGVVDSIKEKVII